MVHEHILNGQVVYLVQPQHIGCTWTRENKVFRSSVWDSEGNLVSAGFPKFVNWGEKPESFPVPTELKDCTIMEKLDGSLLIVSKWNGQYILRTRGTVDASKLDNGHELEVFKQTILPNLGVGQETWPFSFLFEWTSPNQKIILNYGEDPSWTLVGVVQHENYSLFSQDELNHLAHNMGFKRPETYTFTTLIDLLSLVDKWKGKEGVVIYSNEGQTLHKVKSDWYKHLHAMKSELGSFDKLIDTWIHVWDKPTYLECERMVTECFDWELFDQIRGDVSRISDAWKEVQMIVSKMQSFADDLNEVLDLPRKDKALKIISSYGQTNRASFVFKLLDGKSLSDDDLKKLLYQVLKK